MRVPLTARFFEQAEQYGFRFTCPDCIHHTGDACAHEWPTDDHVRPPAADATELVTCKEFELA